MFLPVKIRAEKVGENQRTFPTIETAPIASDDSPIQARYNGETLNGEGLLPPFGETRFNGSAYTGYNWAVGDVGGIEGVFPGASAEGWVTFIVAAEADPTGVVVEIAWRDKTTRWELTDGSE